MSSDYYEHIAGSVNLPVMRRSRVVVAGVGTVGSQIAMELARCGVGRFLLIDGDHLEESNRSRHILPIGYVGMNKAEAMTLHLDHETPDAHPLAEPRHIDQTMSDAYLDELLREASLIIAATDNREAQRRVGRRALALGVTAIFPALYTGGGGEVVVQLDPRLPCFSCWDGFRSSNEQLRGVTAINSDAQPIIHVATKLSLGILDPDSEHRRLIAGERSAPLRQLFVQRPESALQMMPLTRRPNCPSCAVGPSLLRPDAVEAWAAAGGTRNARSVTMARPESVARPEGVRWWLIAILIAFVLLVSIMAMNSGSGQNVYPPSEPAPSPVTTQEAPPEAAPADSSPEEESEEEGGESEGGEETKEE